MELLVSHSRGRFGRARREIRAALRRLGDEHAEVVRAVVDGVARVSTALDPRQVVRRCRDLAGEDFEFRFAVKWIPVDYWCDTDADAMRDLIEASVRDRIGTGESWRMQVVRRAGDKYHGRDLVARLAGAIDRKVDLERPDKIVRIDMLGARTAVSVLRPDEIFSVQRDRPPAPRQEAPDAVPGAPR